MLPDTRVSYRRMVVHADGSTTLHIPRKVPTQNSLAANKGGAGAWFRYQTESRCWLNEIPFAPKPAAGPRRVSIIRLMSRGERKFDPLNLCGGLKPVMDALIKRGHLLDDSEELLKFVYPPIQRRPTAGEFAPSTVIVIQPVP